MAYEYGKAKMRIAKIILLSVCVLFIFQTQRSDAKQAERRRKDKTSSPPERPQATNICDSDRESPVHCYCEGTMAIKNVSKAQCWILKKGLSIDDPVWDAFQTQNRLVDLMFNVRADGAFTFVPTRALRYLRRLRKFEIMYAEINDVYPFAFANLSSLNEILLTKNQIVTLEQNAFAHMSNLTTLKLKDNKIVEIGKNCFVDMPVLVKLTLSQNNITVIQDGAFKQLVQLLELDLDINSITTLNRDTFDGLANLKRLDLQENRMKMLGDFTFAELWNLQELLLDNNELKFISERAFDGLSQLKKLSLSKNRLATLTGGLFEGVRGLSYLDMRLNRLHTLTIDDIRPILDNLKNASSLLLLDDNEFSCDCRLTWMHALRNDTKNDQTQLSLEQITCSLDPSQLHVDHALTKQKMMGGVPLDHNLDNQIHDKKASHKVYNQKSTLDYVDTVESPYKGNADEEIYDEAQKDGNPAQHNKTKKENQKLLFQIPIEQLPCPEELKDSTDAPLLRPSRGEVKDFRGINSGTYKVNFNSMLCGSTVSFIVMKVFINM
ncbi:uncharacterized protein LOC143914925 [Arctopsyche grandis]|uniref:uncharacterized protein LOC143914925 n=1 Tax=Arctopsyche grandis TaxID=121162 RepID=UPI00406D7D1C